MIPIIAMSAKDAREDMDACKEAGMNDYLATVSYTHLTLPTILRV